MILSYWNTLRFNKRFAKWWDKGCNLAVVITGRCNLHCGYCPMFLTDNKYPRFQESTLEQWKTFFENYPDWISQVNITGGEPSLVPYVSELVNWLVDRGHHVILYSNLKNPEAFLGIKKSFRFVIMATCHETDDIKRFLEAYKVIKGKFRIIVKEIETNRLGSLSTKAEKMPKKWFEDYLYSYHVAPDSPITGKIYMGCNNTYKDGKL